MRLEGCQGATLRIFLRIKILQHGWSTAFPDVGLEYAVRRYDSFESDLVLLYGATLGPAGESESI